MGKRIFVYQIDVLIMTYGMIRNQSHEKKDLPMDE